MVKEGVWESLWPPVPAGGGRKSQVVFPGGLGPVGPAVCGPFWRAGISRLGFISALTLWQVVVELLFLDGESPTCSHSKLFPRLAVFPPEFVQNLFLEAQLSSLVCFALPAPWMGWSHNI